MLCRSSGGSEAKPGKDRNNERPTNAAIKNGENNPERVFISDVVNGYVRCRLKSKRN